MGNCFPYGIAVILAQGAGDVKGKTDKEQWRAQKRREPFGDEFWLPERRGFSFVNEFCCYVYFSTRRKVAKAARGRQGRIAGVAAPDPRC